MNAKRKLKELEYQNPWNILNNYRAWGKKGAKIGCTGSGLIVNITTLGVDFGHECYITGETFNKYVQPAITKALKETLEQQRTYLKILDSQIMKEIGECDTTTGKTTGGTLGSTTTKGL